jgi:hypothetical protein
VIDNAGILTTNWSTPLDLGVLSRLGSWTISGDAMVSTPTAVFVANGDPAQLSGLIISKFLQVGTLWVNGQWVYGNLIGLDVGTQSGRPAITIYSKPNDPYVIEASTNLSLWTPILTNASTNGIFEWIETNTFPARFFRSHQ